MKFEAHKVLWVCCFTSECGTTEYDKNTRICCKDILHDRPAHIPQYYQGCCEYEVINTYSTICCNAQIRIKMNEEFRCCDTNAFDRTTHMCCNGVVNIRGNENYRCCETESFDRTIASCTGGVIIYNNASPTSASTLSATLPYTTYDPVLPPACK